MSKFYYTESWYFPSENKVLQEKIPVYMPTIGEEECFLENICCANYEKLPCNLYIAQRGNHGNGLPRFKFQLDDDTKFKEDYSFSMTVSDNPKIIGGKNKGKRKFLIPGIDKMGKLAKEDIIFLVAFARNEKNKKVFNDLLHGNKYTSLPDAEKDLRIDEITQSELDEAEKIINNQILIK